MAAQDGLTIMSHCVATDRHKYRPPVAPSPLLHALDLSVQITPKELYENVMKFAPKHMQQ